MSRQLTEPEAWREIARRIAEGKWRKIGICAELNDVYVEGSIPAGMLRDMANRIGQHIDAMEHRSNAAYKFGTEPEARILAALWLALEAEEDGA